MKTTRALCHLYLLLFCIGTVTSTPALAEVYRSVDENGNIIFTDRPDEDPTAEQLDLQDPNTVKSINVPEHAPTGPDKAASTYGVTITSPSDQQHFPNRLLPITVSARVTPKLREGHSLRLLVDGKPQGTSGDSFTVEGLAIGEHTLQVEILSQQGGVVAQSKAITIYTSQPG